MTQSPEDFIIKSQGYLPEVCASSLFLPTFYSTDSIQGAGCHAPAQAIGDGKNLPIETDLLNIAGEKMEGSGTLGYPRSCFIQAAGMRQRERKVKYLPLLCLQDNKLRRQGLLRINTRKRHINLNTRSLQADHQGILTAAGILSSGGLVAFPTETVYGLGANALDEQAVAGIFTAKGRPMDNPLIVHVPGLQEALQYAVFTPLGILLARAFWPGPLTLILTRRDVVPSSVSAGLDTLALRAPDHPAAQALLRASGLPIAAPSANRSGRPSPTLAEHVLEDMDGRIPLILDGGPCQVGLESTVLDARGQVPLILRPGAVTPEMVAMAAGDCQVADSVMRDLQEGEEAPSPGMRHQHYAPKARMTLIKGSPHRVEALLLELASGRPDTWVLAMEHSMPRLKKLTAHSMGKDAKDAAHRLFYLLRQADTQGVARIYAQALPPDGLGLAVMNRLARASAFDIMDADAIKGQLPW